MADAEQNFDRDRALMKRAAKVTEALENANAANVELMRKTADQAERIEELQKVANDQSALIDAQTQAIYMVKEGEIDPEQIQEVVDNILEFGPDLYKRAMAVAGTPSTMKDASFGELTDSSETGVEKSGQYPTYNGVEVTNPVEQVLLEHRAKQYGVPGLNW